MLRSLPESWREIVADTSAIINLNATGRAEELLRLFPSPPVVTEAVRSELRGAHGGVHRDIEELDSLVRARVCRIVDVDDRAPILVSLLEGGARDTLGDGEAATVAYAVAHDRAAMIDERKARRICSERFPASPIVFTVDFLLHPCVRAALGARGQADAVFAALQGARMRVPFERVPEVVALIGEDRAALCRSLPRSALRSPQGG